MNAHKPDSITAGTGGGESPDSGSLYNSDEIPSGYNSGEQYDTLSTGYMSGEAYELPDTRLELQEPALDVIEECLQPLGGGQHPGSGGGGGGGVEGNAADDSSDAANIFVLPGLTAVSHDRKEKDNVSVSSSSSAGMVPAPAGTNEAVAAFRRVVAAAAVSSGDHPATALHARSPGHAGPPGKSGKKPPASLSIPMESTPLSAAIDHLRVHTSNSLDPESSDTNLAPTGGYRVMPSDTDTSAFDSDAIGLAGSGENYEDGGLTMVVSGGGGSGGGGPGPGGHPSDSGTDRPLLHASQRSKTKSDRLASRKAKRMRRHDEEWFNNNDNKWWRATRQVCFWGSVLSMVASTVAAAVLIYQMPRQCDPPHEWYQGKVFLEVTPEVYNGQFSNLDLEKFKAALPGYSSLGIQTVHLKGLNSKLKNEDGTFTNYPTEDWKENYLRLFKKPEEHQMNSTLISLVNYMHDLNMTLVVQIAATEREGKRDTEELAHSITKAIRYWAKIGTDGIFLDGLEHFVDEQLFDTYLGVWNDVFKKYARTKNRSAFMCSYDFIRVLEKKYEERNDGGDSFNKVLGYFSLLDTTLDLDSRNIAEISRDVLEAAVWGMAEGRPWINWNMRLAGRSVGLPLTKAHLAFQFFLPGTISVEATADRNGSAGGHGVPGDVPSPAADSATLRNLTRVRTIAVPIFMNGNYRRCECPDRGGYEKESNLVLKEVGEGGEGEAGGRGLVQMERFYSRRNRYVLVANFGEEETGLEAVAELYSYGELLVDTTGKKKKQEVYIKEMKLAPGHAFVIKLPK